MANPASLLNVLNGTETSQPLVLHGSTTIGSYTPGSKTPVTVAAATTTLTLAPATHSGRIVTLASTAGLTITPPAATGTGDVYELVFIATISGGNVTLDAKAGNASDVFYGWLQTYKATTFTPYITASNSNLLTFDGSTRGGIKGDVIRLRDAGTNIWVVEGFTTQSGTIASPFSNH